MKDIILKMSLKNFTDLDTTKMMANLAKKGYFLVLLRYVLEEKVKIRQANGQGG